MPRCYPHSNLHCSDQPGVSLRAHTNTLSHTPSHIQVTNEHRPKDSQKGYPTVFRTAQLLIWAQQRHLSSPAFLQGSLWQKQYSSFQLIKSLSLLELPFMLKVIWHPFQNQRVGPRYQYFDFQNANTYLEVFHVH